MSDHEWSLLLPVSTESRVLFAIIQILMILSFNMRYEVYRWLDRTGIGQGSIEFCCCWFQEDFLLLCCSLLPNDSSDHIEAIWTSQLHMGLSVLQVSFLRGGPQCEWHAELWYQSWSWIRWGSIRKLGTPRPWSREQMDLRRWKWNGEEGEVTTDCYRRDRSRDWDPTIRHRHVRRHEDRLWNAGPGCELTDKQSSVVVNATCSLITILHLDFDHHNPSWMSNHGIKGENRITCVPVRKDDVRAVSNMQRSQTAIPNGSFCPGLSTRNNFQHTFIQNVKWNYCCFQVSMCDTTTVI